MLRELREFLQWRAGGSIILAEANVMPERQTCSTSATTATACT